MLASRTYADDPRMVPFLAGRPIAERRPVSSALKFCRVAEGVADLYPRFGGTMEWDTAAGQALVEAAGGSVTAGGRQPAALRQAGLAEPRFRLPWRSGRVTEQLGPDDVARAAALLRQGALVAFPTETVYGLGGDATDGRAVAGIFAAKGRPHFNPLICHYPSAEAAFADVRADDRARALAAAFWPGPLTLVLPRRADCRVDLLAGAGLDTLAVRVPANPARARRCCARWAGRWRRPRPTAPARSARPRRRMCWKGFRAASPRCWMAAPARSASRARCWT